MYRVEMVPKMVCLMNKCITLGVYNVILEERFYRRKSNFHIAKCCTYQKNGRKSLTIRQKMCICGIFTWLKAGYKCYKPSIHKAHASWDVVWWVNILVRLKKMIHPKLPIQPKPISNQTEHQLISAQLVLTVEPWLNGLNGLARFSSGSGFFKRFSSVSVQFQQLEPTV